MISFAVAFVILLNLIRPHKTRSNANNCKLNENITEIQRKMSMLDSKNDDGIDSERRQVADIIKGSIETVKKLIT